MKNQFFLRGAIVQVQQFETGTKYGLNVLHQCDKRVKLKVRKF